MRCPANGSWHTEKAPSEAHAAAHIGLYFRWCLVSGLLSDELTSEEDLEVDLKRVRTGELSATEFLWENTSGKLGDADLTDEGNRLTKWFYDKHCPGLLFEVAGAGAYEFTDDQVRFSELKARLDQAFQQWRALPRKRPWWKLW